MSYIVRKRKPKSKATKRPLRPRIHVELKTEAPFSRQPSMQFDPISNEWNIIDRQPVSTKVTEHGECQTVWRADAKDLTLWAKLVKWVRGWHG